MTSIGNILMTLGFIILIGLFFGLNRADNIFVDMKEHIQSFNDNFLSLMPTEILFIVSFLVFILVLSYIISFFKQ